MKDIILKLDKCLNGIVIENNKSKSDINRKTDYKEAYTHLHSYLEDANDGIMDGDLWWYFVASPVDRIVEDTLNMFTDFPIKRGLNFYFGKAMTNILIATEKAYKRK